MGSAWLTSGGDGDQVVAVALWPEDKEEKAKEKARAPSPPLLAARCLGR